MPLPESATRRLAIRAFALVTLTISIAYLVWRAGYTIDLGSWWVAIPFYALEVHAVLSLALFTYSLWNVDVRPKGRRTVDRTDKKLAVFIPTYNEDREVLLPAVAAAVALEPAHETWVLDDGCRPEVEKLAVELGAKYLARADRTGAKAGNINNALAQIDVDFIAIIDADHVVAPNFLRHTLGYFDDSRVAIVQTPQEFYNLESFEHERHEQSRQGDRQLYHEQSLFYRLIQPGKNRWGAAFWCGTGAVVRTDALNEIGGLATDTVTEDIHTTIRLHRRGWKTVYHNEVLARGLAASSSDQFQIQRFRWGTGAMQLLRTENPLIVSGLTIRQRLAYSATLSGWFEAWRTLGYILIPIVVLLTGGMPIRAPVFVFAIAFGVTFGSQQAALRLLSRGYHRYVLMLVFELVRMTPNILATLTLFVPGDRAFQVTPKGRQSDGRTRMSPPPLLILLVSLNIVATFWFVLTVTELVSFRYPSLSFAYGAAFWALINSGLMILAISRVISPRYGPERRSSVRFGSQLDATLDGRHCSILEISLTGAQVSMEGVVGDELIGRRHGLTVGLLDDVISIGVVARWKRPDRSGHSLLGLEFVDGQTLVQARLALGLLNGEIRSVPESLPLAA